MWTVELVVIFFMIFFNSIFAGYEIALASVGEGRLNVLATHQSLGYQTPAMIYRGKD